MDSLSHQLNFQNYTILIVDDTLANLSVGFDFLDRQGFEIIIAWDGQSGLKKAQYNQPDLILLDALMPGLDGFEVCRRLKAEPITQAIPVIFMTALTSTQDVIKGFNAGAVDYVTKPIRHEELLARIVTHLYLGQLTQQLQSTNKQLQQEVDERTKAEAELKDYQDHLAELVEQRTAELTQTNKQLQQEMIERRQAEAEIRQQSQQLRNLTKRLADVEEAERHRLARELHDRVGQDLAALDLNLNIIRAQISPEVTVILHPLLQDSLALLKQVAKHVHDVMADLRSPVLDDYGLIAALNWYSSQFSARTNIHVVVYGPENSPRLPQSTENALLRIAQEALTNVAKHAQASQVTVTATWEADLMRLTITDNGLGFDPTRLGTPTEGQGWGMISMKERAEVVGGYCQIKTQPQQGTQVVVEVGR